MVGKNPDEGEVVKSDGYPERCLLSPTRLSQVNKVKPPRVRGWSVTSGLQSKGILGKTERRRDRQ